MSNLSVVIPVFNGADTIAATLDSLRKQSFADFEVICVDDGSIDDSLEILSMFAAEDSRFRFVSQPNSGAGAARNAGIELASGDYLYFLDSDDLLLPNAFGIINDQISKFHPEVLVFKYRQLNNADGRIGSQRLGIQDWCATFNTTYKPPNSTIFQLTTPEAWIRVVSSDFIKARDLRFQEIPRANDLYFAWSAMSESETTLLLDVPLILHRVSRGKSLQSTSDESPLAPLEALSRLRDRLAERIVSDQDLRRSFVNAALGVVEFHLSSLRHEQNIHAAFESAGVFVKKLDVTGESSEYFYEYGYYKLVHSLADTKAQGYFFEKRRDETKRSERIQRELLRLSAEERRLAGLVSNQSRSLVSRVMSRIARRVSKFRSILGVRFRRSGVTW